MSFITRQKSGFLMALMGFKGSKHIYFQSFGSAELVGNP